MILLCGGNQVIYLVENYILLLQARKIPTRLTLCAGALRDSYQFLLNPSFVSEDIGIEVITRAGVLALTLDLPVRARHNPQNDWGITHAIEATPRIPFAGLRLHRRLRRSSITDKPRLL